MTTSSKISMPPASEIFGVAVFSGSLTLRLASNAGVSSSCRRLASMAGESAVSGDAVQGVV
jgi:hypothetical protein